MWALVGHLKDSCTAHLTKNLLWHCKRQLRRWLENVKFGQHMVRHRKYIILIQRSCFLLSTWIFLANVNLFYRMRIFKCPFIFLCIDTSQSSFTKLFGIKGYQYLNSYLLHMS